MEPGEIDSLLAALDVLKEKDLDIDIKELVLSRSDSLPKRSEYDELLLKLSHLYKEVDQTSQAIKSGLVQEKRIEVFYEEIFSAIMSFLDQTSALSEIAPTIWKCLESLQNDFYYSETNEERILRPTFVGLQGLIEESIVKLKHDKKIQHVVGAIHTILPATPVCTQAENTKSLIHESEENNQLIVESVRSRAMIIRDYLSTESKLFIIYHKESRNKRTEEQLRIYEGLISEFEGLRDHQVTEMINEEISGATYLMSVEGIQGQFVFSINARQANVESEVKQWKIFLGHESNQAIQEHLRNVLGFFDFRNLD